MKIESFSLYHIGIKLNPGVELSDLRTIVEDFSKLNPKYELIKKEANIMQAFPVGLNMGVDEIMKINSTKIYLNLPLQALNFAGKNPEEVSKIFQEFVEYFNKLDKFDISKVFGIMEVIVEAITSNSKSPSEILNESVKINLEELQKLDTRASIAGIRIRSEFSGINGLDVSVEPYALRPNKNFIIRLIWQTKDIDAAAKFNLNVNSYIEKIIK